MCFFLCNNNLHQWPRADTYTGGSLVSTQRCSLPGCTLQVAVALLWPLTCSSPLLGTVPPDGRKAVTPTVVAGHTTEPHVSLPMANGSSPAAGTAAAVALSGDIHSQWSSKLCGNDCVRWPQIFHKGCLVGCAAEHLLLLQQWVQVVPAAAVHPPAATPAADPALLPQLPVSTFQGFLVVTSSNHWSPHASSPVAVLASSTAPARPDRALYAQEGCVDRQTHNTAEGQEEARKDHT
jgi:hypothetical protein